MLFRRPTKLERAAILLALAEELQEIGRTILRQARESQTQYPVIDTVIDTRYASVIALILENIVLRIVNRPDQYATEFNDFLNVLKERQEQGDDD